MNKRITGVYMLAAMISASSLLATALISAVPVHASQNNANGREEPAAKTVNKTPQYTCIHHPDITSDSPSTCPKCLMALITLVPGL